MEGNVKSKLLGLQTGALVVLTVIQERGIEQRYRGFCTLFREQEDWTENDYVRLTDAVDVVQDIKSIRPQFFTISKILDVEVLTQSVETNSDIENELEDEPIEEILPTTVITEKEQLEALIETIRGIPLLGFSLEGQNIGRFGQVTWVNLLVKSTIVALPIQQLSFDMGGESNLWSKLQTTIFSNPTLVKVIHDSRGAADYLFHNHGISLQNVFDIMVADVYIMKTTKNESPQEFKSLSKCLEEYLPGKVHSQELNLLREYENNSSQTSGWSSSPDSLPPPILLKIGALKIKYLLALREILLWTMMEGYRNTVNSRIDYVLSNH